MRCVLPAIVVLSIPACGGETPPASHAAPPGAATLSGNIGLQTPAQHEDQDTDPPGPATVTDTNTAPPLPYQPTLDRLLAIAVRTKLPQFKTEDSANLARVADALALATADMFVHYAMHGQTDFLPALDLVPQRFTGIGFGGVGYTSGDTSDAGTKAKGLARYGGENEGFSHCDTPKNNHMQVVAMQGYPPRLAEGTPGLVWDVDFARVAFVSLDGGRYAVDVSRSDNGQTLDAGAGPQANWPPAARDALLTVPDVSSLVRAGALPQKNIDDLLALDEEWNKCAARVWSSAQRAIDANTLTEADGRDYERKARARCAPMVQKQEALLVTIVQARLKDRMDLLAKARARVGQVGADH
jgi:hypothetical protein